MLIGHRCAHQLLTEDNMIRLITSKWMDTFMQYLKVNDR